MGAKKNNGIRNCSNCKLAHTENCPRFGYSRSQVAKPCKKHKYVECIAKMNLFR